ncbi:MAG: GNAT family N-acetyltransferase, partial [Actinomycetota bacterium]|nr:GNAT family N-acetyltransferase [Actinomycetota bacterium]
TGRMPAGDRQPPLDPRQRARRPTAIVVRRVTPDDAPLLAEGFARLSAESRRLRFLVAKTRLSEAELRYFTEVDGHHHEALVAIDPATGQGIGIARFVRDEHDDTSAEIAVTVVDEWQRRGVAKRLLAELADRARQEGVRRFTALVGADNRGMHKLLDRLGAPVRVVSVGDGTLEYEIELPPKGLGAQVEEALRAAAAGRLRPPPALSEVLRGLVPIQLERAKRSTRAPRPPRAPGSG